MQNDGSTPRINRWLYRFPSFCILHFAFCILPACTTATVEQPLTATVGGNDDDAQIEFWHGLNEQPVASHDDAFHALLLFVEGEDPANDYAGRVAELEKRGMLPNGFDGKANEAITRGTLAVAIVKILEIEGGLTMRLLGPLPRYATRELQYVGVYPASSDLQVFSGAQFLAIMGRVEDYQRLQEVTPSTEQLDDNEPPADEAVPGGDAPVEGAENVSAR